MLVLRNILHIEADGILTVPYMMARNLVYVQCSVLGVFARDCISCGGHCVISVNVILRKIMARVWDINI